MRKMMKSAKTQKQAQSEPAAVARRLEDKIEEEIAAASKVAHEAAKLAYVRVFRRVLDEVLHGASVNLAA